MMYGYGACWGWMILMPLVWLGLAGVIVWAVARLVQRPSDAGRPTQRRETPQEILDRRFASGEIDADAYTKARAPGRTRTGIPMTRLRRWLPLAARQVRR